MAQDTARAGDEAVHIGSSLFGAIKQEKEKDSYQPNGLPPLNLSRFTDDVVASLQKRAMQIE